MIKMEIINTESICKIEEKKNAKIKNKKYPYIYCCMDERWKIK